MLDNHSLVDGQLLTHEMQLGESLNQCVHSERRADFSLMLAILVDDACQFSQFKLPKNTADNSATSTPSNLRAYFELAKPQALAIENNSQINQFNQAKLVQQRLDDLRLLNAIAPVPLCFRDDKQHIETPVLENTSAHCQQQTRKNASENSENGSLAFNAEKWLKAVQNALVQAPLLAV